MFCNSLHYQTCDAYKIFRDTCRIDVTKGGLITRRSLAHLRRTVSLYSMLDNLLRYAACDSRLMMPQTCHAKRRNPIGRMPAHDTMILAKKYLRALAFARTTVLDLASLKDVQNAGESVAASE